MRGGERCLEVFCELFPDAPLYTLLHVPGSVSPVIERRRIVTSFVQRLPGRGQRATASTCRCFPPRCASLRSARIRSRRCRSSHCVAKAVRVRPGALHLCYCFTPMRYVWDLEDDYAERRAARLTRLVLPPLAAALRRWDRADGRRRRVRGDLVATSPIGSAASTRATPRSSIRRWTCARFRARRQRWTTTTWWSRRWCRTSAWTWPSARRPTGSAAGCWSSARARRSARLRALAGPNVTLPRLADRRRGRRALRALPGGALPGRRGLRHRAAGGRGGRPADDRAGPRRGARDDGGARRGRRAARPAVFFASQTVDAVVDAIRRLRAGRARASIRGRSAARAAPLRSPDLRASGCRSTSSAAGARSRGPGVLKAHSRLFEHLALVADLVLIAVCWLGAYALRFHVFGAVATCRRSPTTRCSCCRSSWSGASPTRPSTSTGRVASARTCPSGSTSPRPPRWACSSSSRS